MVFTSRFLNIFVFLGSLIAFLSVSCSPRTPLIKPLSHEERIRRDQAIGAELSQHLESGLKFKTEREVSIYLRLLAQTLIDKSPEMNGGSVDIWLIHNKLDRKKSDGNKEEKWQNYALPGNRLYLSVGMLKLLEYENEVAAVVAIQLGHVLRRHVLKHIREHFEPKNKIPPDVPVRPMEEVLSSFLKRLDELDFLGPDGIFNYSEEEESEAVRTAARILYRAGYDARGMIAVFNLCQDNSDNCPYEDSTISKLIEATRREIASSAPLRNPIVRSHSFLQIQKRIQHL